MALLLNLLVFKDGKFSFKKWNLEFLQYGIYEEPQSWNIAGEGTVNLIYMI